MRKIILLYILLFTMTGINYAQKNCTCGSFSNSERIKLENAINTGGFEEATAFIENQKKSDDPCCRLIGLTLEAMLQNAQSKPDLSLATALQVQANLKKSYNLYADVMSNLTAGLYYSKKGNADSSNHFYFRGLEAATNAKEYYLQARMCLSIGNAYSNRKLQAKNLEYQKKGVALALQSLDLTTIAQAYSYLVTAYGRMYDDTEKEIYVDSAALVAPVALQYAKAINNRTMIIRNYLSMGKFEMVRKHFDKALLYSDTLQTLLTEKSSPTLLNSFYTDRGVALTGLNRHDEAIENLNKAFEYTKQSNNAYLRRSIHDRLYEAYKAKEDPKMALLYLEKFRVINDSLVKKENMDAATEMEAKYNKAQDQRAIKELAQQKRIYVLLATAGLFALIGLIFFIRQQTLKNKQKILETEQRLNRARMNPHFFFNALSSLQSFALQGNDGKSIASNLSKFSHIMRETLESTYKEYVTVEQETDFLNEYLELQKVRFPQKFTYAITSAPDIEPEELLLPSMILQPFVENSIEHGFTGIDYAGHISVSFNKSGNDLHINITDNGKGLATSPKEESEHISRASQIIRDRIYLLNIKLKTRAGFSIDNNPEGKGVLVKISLPVLYKQDMKKS
ncbi:MAG: histidine kinase [Bacteroidetes bacterium]|nr:histidine kinase [Bacteroidota bacterium]